MPTIADLLVEQGRVLADARRRRGERAVALVTSLGTIPGAIVADRDATRAAQVAAARQMAADDRAQTATDIAVSAENRALTKAEHDAKALQDAKVAEQRGKEAVQGWIKQHAADLQPGEADRMLAILETPGGTAHLIDGLSKAPAPYTLNPGDVRYGPDNQQVAANPRPVEPPKVTFGEPKAVTVNGQKKTARPGSDGNWYIGGALVDGDVQLYEKPDKASENEPLVAIVGPDGQSVLVPRSQAIGKRPANAREQGRPVISGDANRLADFDTSLNETAAVRAVIAARDPKTGKLKETGATGTVAKIGASLPDWATNLIGWTTPKQKQATIDRVKQVIGKALEGGVLRKEDEIKYEKILPKIYDPIEVVETKLNGLDAALGQRKQTLLDSLEDAGYDVSRFRKRERGAADKADPGGIR